MVGEASPPSKLLTGPAPPRRSVCAPGDDPVSFEVTWGGRGQLVHHRNPANRFAGTFVENSATISWTARQPGFVFVSDPASTSVSLFAEVGHERNGIFFG